ncbi:MAG: hypothetical protein BWX80_02326 [Candidatus Hydrogenedentes bacterium ADurb.Bin101]|nr:MAG: hypothetical protein BWX80_02326 [Candidatus Hydrogenedentes bacterium ADurb.Bin101]
MKVLYSEGVANHTGPGPWLFSREGLWQALAGESMGRVLSRENFLFRGADDVPICGRPHWHRRNRDTLPDPARSKTPSTCRRSLRGTREIPLLSLDIKDRAAKKKVQP